MLEPSTQAEWAFLSKCARGDFDDPQVEAGAIETLRLIASPKSRKVLEALHPKDEQTAFGRANE
jgi:hypothetical protein